MKQYEGIAIHCSDSNFGTAQDIEDWHKERGWDDIGYHIVITNGYIDKDRFVDFMDGSIEIGRDWNVSGAHVKGYNSGYLGICLIGKNYFTVAQYSALSTVLKSLAKTYNIDSINIKGHYQFPRVTKTCPNFDVIKFKRLYEI